MPRTKKKSNKYWTNITEYAVASYNKIENPITREKVYRRFLYPALMKMSENLINTLKPEYIDSSFEDLQTDLVTFLTERLSKFNPNAGKAYSYYTRTGFNYLIAENQKAYSKLKNQQQEINIDEERNVMIEIHNSEMQEVLHHFMDAYIQYCYDNLNIIFTTQADIHVADSILHIFETRENLEQFNKKALYILIRERTGLETNNITRVIKTLKEIYQTKYLEYEKLDYIKLPF